ncbi:hypothetical protein KIN20_016806 [Parelaphostrongylus tenuis]|uniref:BED-type domain-containing protein n=1 Tax=Parelaphostrongylus tenuis TaxID=148309 RepID=A0AAD5MH10_PARTN|nr:hypothetical protein KIN20_016806 [Parelaphostrongylus tenuis]
MERKSCGGKSQEKKGEREDMDECVCIGMTSLLGGNSILHIANRLGGLKKEMPNEVKTFHYNHIDRPIPPEIRISVDCFEIIDSFQFTEAGDYPLRRPGKLHSTTIRGFEKIRLEQRSTTIVKTKHRLTAAQPRRENPKAFVGFGCWGNESNVGSAEIRLDPEGTPSPTPSVVVRQVTPLSETIAFPGIAATESPLPSLSMPPLPPPNNESNVVMSLFKDKETFTTSPSTSESATSGGVNEPTTLVSTHIDLNAAISHIQQQLNVTQSQHIQNDVKDLLPGYSPWMRNAGRKKSHPVWEFFKDLKDTNGVGGVICLHCSWQGDDRSPNNLRTHLKKFHSSDGVFARFSEKLAQTPTQPYVKRARAGGNSQTAPPSDSVALAFQQLQSASQLGNPFNFLENLPKSSEVINISAGYPVEDEEQENAHEEIQAGSSGGSLAGDTASPLREDAATSGGSPSVTSTNHLSAFMNMATNPLMWNAMLVNTSTHGSAFSLNDGQCVSMLMKMALDLDLTLSYHKRRGDIELCFESNRTAEKSGGRGKVLCLSDMGREIRYRVIERVNGTPTDTEMWTKTDFNQFHWAIRGKCQKVLVKG